MARDYVINGETLCKVKFGQHFSGQIVSGSFSLFGELGLSVDKVVVSPHFRHKDIHVDDFGPDVPAEVQWMLATVDVRMTLVHYDKDILDLCLSESMGGTFVNPENEFVDAGLLQPTGVTLGRGVLPLNSGCHYLSLNLLSPQLLLPWRFPTSHLSEFPVEVPLGTERSAVICNFRAVPYRPFFVVGEAVSSGIVLWDRTLDTP